MAITNNTQQLYGVNGVVISSPVVQVASRAPGANDRYAVGTEWIDEVAFISYILTGYSSGTPQWKSTAGDAGSFTSLTVSPGLTTLSALTQIGTASINGTGSSDTTIGNDGGGDIEIASGNDISINAPSSIAIGNESPLVDRLIVLGAGDISTAGVNDLIDIGGDDVTNTTASRIVSIVDGDISAGTMQVNVGIGDVTGGTHSVNIGNGTGAGATSKSVVIGNIDENTVLNFNGVNFIVKALASGATTGVTGPKGSLLIDRTATTATTRLYINTDGNNTWASFTASA